MFSLNNNFSAIVLALTAAGILASSAVHAQAMPQDAGLQQAVPHSPYVAGSAAKEISKINEEIAVLTAKLNKLKVEAEISVKKKEIEGAASALDENGALPVQGAGPNMQRDALNSTQVEVETETPAPAIHSIEGVDGKLYATLIFSGGMNQIVQKGEVIKDGWKVVGLTSSSVTLSRGGKETRLGFGLPPAAEPQRASGYGGPSGFPGAPSFQ